VVNVTNPLGTLAVYVGNLMARSVIGVGSTKRGRYMGDGKLVQFLTPI